MEQHPSHLVLADPVRAAMDGGRPVVALESTVIAHGLPYPDNLATARHMEAIVRDQGAVPATIAILDGSLRVGLADADLELLATARGVRKVSRRDLPVVVAQKLDGATTVAATATIAAWAGIRVFATGGIGGVHRGNTADVSNDLTTLATVPVAVVCSGAKSILDLPATLEWLETAGVPVVGYGTDEFPAFYSRHSGLRVDTRVDSPDEAAAIVYAARRLGLRNSVLIVVPVPEPDEMPAEAMERLMPAALDEARQRGIEGNAVTPFLLGWLAQASRGESLRANLALLNNNAAVAGQIAVALNSLEGA